MFKLILLPISAGLISERAAKYALGFAQAVGASVSVVHVHRSGDAIDQDEALLARCTQQAQALGVPCSSELLTSDGKSVGEVIALHAENLVVDLIAMGTHAREGLNRLLLGSVAERVVRLVKQPVLLLHGVNERFAGFRSMLVPLEAEDDAPALTVATRLSQAMAARITALHVVPDIAPPLADPSGLSPLIAYRPAEAAAALEAQGRLVLDQVRERFPDVQTRLEHAAHQAIWERILAVSQEHDLIVMATHGHAGLERLLLGSVAEAVAHHASIPVLLVRYTAG